MPAFESRWQFPDHEARSLASGQAGETALALARVWARLPCPAAVVLKKVGEVQLQPDLITVVDELPPSHIDDMAWFCLGRATEQAWVGVTLDACHGMIRAVLGGAAPQLIRPLGAAERGLMAAIVLSGLKSLGVAHRVTIAFQAGKPPLHGPGVLLGGAIRGAEGIEGRVLFIGPWAWLANGIGPLPPALAIQDRVEAVLELGRTIVPEADLRAAELGDAIAFDGIPGVAPGDTWPANLLVGSSWAPARLGTDGRLTLDGIWAPIASSTADTLDGDRRQETPGPLLVVPADVHSHAPREVVAEIGLIRLRPDELAGLIKGQSLMLGPRPADHVFLRVGGRLWATGELVTLSRQLGVRIARLLRD